MTAQTFSSITPPSSVMVIAPCKKETRSNSRLFRDRRVHKRPTSQRPVVELVSNYLAGRPRPLPAFSYLESGLPKRRMFVAEFSTKLFTIENSGGTTSWAVPSDVNGMNDRMGNPPAA